LPGEVAAARGELADFPILRLRQGVLRAELPTPQELDDLAYFLVAVDRAGEEVGARREGASGRYQAPAHGRRAELFAELAVAKSAGKVLDVEWLARSYLETLHFPDALHGAEEDVFFGHEPRYQHVMRDLAESWEALGRFHQAAGLWRRLGSGRAFAWQEQVKAVIRDEEIEGRCEAAVAERLLDIGGSAWRHDDPYGPRRLRDAGFDVARLLRGALLTRNRDAGEETVLKAIAELPATPRLFAQMRIRDKGVEDWERRLDAARCVADTMQEAAIPLLLAAAEHSLPAGRQRAISALGDLAERPLYDPCRGAMGGRVEHTDDWLRPVRPIEERCAHGNTLATRESLAKAIRGYAGERDVATREAVAVALGKLGVPAARPTLRRLLADPVTGGRICTANATAECRPLYPVREAARRALDNITDLERNWRTAK
jgi:HEAT repeat protein